jgi:hypothetical protein
MMREGVDLTANAFQLDRAALQEIARQRASQYQSAQPFPHIVLDDFLPQAVIDACIEEFPAPEQIDWRILTDEGHSKKLSTKDEALMGPVTRQVIAQLNGGTMISFLEELTGIDGLVPDPHLEGGGLHQLPRGGFLDVHADFNFHKRIRLDRRLNLLLYLNPDWCEEWGGNMELWDPSLTSCEVRVAPVANRVVIFNTTDTSFHGNPQPVTAPDGRTRRSLALYYYTNGRPDSERSKAHSTLYRVGAGQASEVYSRISLTERTRRILLAALPPVIVTGIRRTRAMLRDRHGSQG